MKKERLKIVDCGMQGEGVARKDGKIYFVDNALQGEIVDAVVTKENTHFCMAKAENILQKSACRVQPQCEYYHLCGGCNMQHINYSQQLTIKQKNVENLLRKAKLGCSVMPCVPCQAPFGYRNKLTLYVANRNLCFCQKKSNCFVHIERCLLVDKRFNKLIEILNVFFKTNAKFDCSAVKCIAIRQVGKIFVLNFILARKTNLKEVEICLQNNKIDFALYSCINAKQHSWLPTYPCKLIAGQKDVFANEFGVRYPIFPMSFLQVNQEIKNKIYKQILCEICQNDKVVDAYSGAGLLSAIIAQKANKVFAVEIDKSASYASQILATQNNIDNMHSICGDCAKVVPNLVVQDINCVVFDPTRKGVENKILHAVANANIQKIIYLSCNAATLCRDLKVLCKYGYQIKLIQPYDMFPCTSEIEVLAILKK